MTILRPGRGFALAYFLIISTIIVMLVGSLLVIGQESLRATRSGVDSNRALYAAEAGMTELMARLERDPNWTGSADKVALPNNTGNYSYSFASAPASATENQCVSNLTSSIRTASYRGENTVPPHAALLVVTGRSGLSTRTLEALVVSGLNVEAGDALVASGRVEMEGDVTVDGRKSLTDPEPVVANLHSNLGDGDETVTYSGERAGLPPGTLRVSGALTSSHPGLEIEVFEIDPDSGVAREAGVPNKNFPNPNIEAIVQDARSFPGPTLSGSEIRLTGKNYYDPEGDLLEIHGDLILEDGAQLVVEGNLKVNGSIYGRGQVVVDGTTEFYGDARVSYRQEDYVSVLSSSHVVLRGFDGQEFMEKHFAESSNPLYRDTALYEPGELETGGDVFYELLGVSPPEFSDSWHPLYPIEVPRDTAWRNLRIGIEGVQSIIGAHADENALVAQEGLRGEDGILDSYSALISYHESGSFHLGAFPPPGSPPPKVPALRSLLGSDVSFNNAGILAQNMGGTDTELFLQERFRYIEDMFRIRSRLRTGASMPGGGVESWREHEAWELADGGLFDSLQSNDLSALSELSETEEQAAFNIIQSILELNIDRLGSAYFKGVVYTNGAFIATDDVVVRGSVFVDGNPALDRLVLGEKSFGPGDVGLFGHTTLTFVEEFFEDGIHNLAGNGTLDIKRWTTR